MLIFRKYFVIIVSTFVQSYEHQLQLVMGLFAVMLHMLYANKPFGYSIPSARLLHWYETTSIAVLFFVMWCGMYFSSDISSCSAQDAWCSFLALVAILSNSVFVILLTGRVCSSWFARQKVNERLARLWASARMLISSVLRRRNTGRKDESAVPGLGHGEHSHSVSVVSLSAPGIEMVENPVCSDDLNLNLDRPCL